MTTLALRALTRLERGIVRLCRAMARPLERRAAKQLAARLHTGRET